MLFRSCFGCIIFARYVVVRLCHLLTFCEGRGIQLQRLAPSPLTVIGSSKKARHIFLEPIKFLLSVSQLKWRINLVSLWKLCSPQCRQSFISHVNICSDVSKPGNKELWVSGTKQLKTQTYSKCSNVFLIVYGVPIASEVHSGINKVVVWLAV